MKPLSMLVLLLTLWLPWAARANPVPQSAVDTFHDLVVATAQAGQCPDSVTLADYFGRFGLDLLTPSDKQSIGDNFAAFVPALVAAQAPPHRPQYDVQRLYRRQASPADEVAMVRALRHWLTDRIAEAPLEGMVRVPGKRSIQLARAMAAEMLADWMDTTSTRLIDTLLETDSLDSLARWHLERSRRRLLNPCAGLFLQRTAGGRVRLCLSPDELSAAVICISMQNCNPPEHILSNSELSRIWPLIEESTVCPNTNWGGSQYALVFLFDDGARASLSPTEPGHTVYTDNVTLDSGRQLTIQNEELWNELTTLFHARLGEELD